MSGRNVSYIKQEEPAFLQRFKQQTGYVEGPDIETKRQKLLERDENESEGEEDQPVIVVLKEGDLTAEEADKLKQQNKEKEKEEPPSDGRIIYKKPVKRSGEQDCGLNISTKKKSKTDSVKTEPNSEPDKSKKKPDKTKAVKNAKLLSFDEDEEEEED